MSNGQQNLSIEQALEQIENIVSQMETKQLTLDNSLALYQEGMRLIALCREQLNQAQSKIELIQATKDGSVKTEHIEKGAWL